MHLQSIWIERTQFHQLSFCHICYVYSTLHRLFMQVLTLSSSLYEFWFTTCTNIFMSLCVYYSPFELWMLIKRHFLLFLIDGISLTPSTSVSSMGFIFSSPVTCEFPSQKKTTIYVWPAMATDQKKTIFWFEGEKNEHQMLKKKVFKIFRLWFVKHIIAI